jgi:Uma2 family endonuclease
MQSMTREEYRAWVERQPVGRFERIDGVVVAIAPERVEHNDRKILAWLALRRAIRDAGAPCRVQGDGMAVPEPLIVVEVLSPSTSATDRAWKLREYFRLPSLRHYLIVWADRHQIVHHRRDDASAIATSVLTSGELRLDPPGITVGVEEIYAD